MFDKAGSSDRKGEPEVEASLKFEFGSEPVCDEPSPKTPEFSEIVENKLEKTMV